MGRSVEAKLNALAKAASSGPTPMRTAAIHELSFYYGFPIEPLLERLLSDSDAPVSRAAAVALVRSIPSAPQRDFSPRSYFEGGDRAPERRLGTGHHWRSYRRGVDSGFAGQRFGSCKGDFARDEPMLR